MYKAVLIDDEPLSREIIKAYLRKHPEVKVVEECNDGFEGLKAVQEHKPDLIFLDIQMPKINGFEMLELIDDAPHVIFVTAFDEYAIKAFEINAVDYLLKPFSEERFRKALERFLEKSEVQVNTRPVLDAMAATPAQQSRIVVKTGTKIKIIPLHEIVYLEADDDYVRIVTADGQYLKSKTLSFYEQTLDPSQFVRVHRSYIVPLKQITRIDPYHKESYMALLTAGKQIPVSKSGYLKLKQLLDI